MIQVMFAATASVFMDRVASDVSAHPTQTVHHQKRVATITVGTVQIAMDILAHSIQIARVIRFAVRVPAPMAIAAI